MPINQERIAELEERVRKLEQKVFGNGAALVQDASEDKSSQLRLNDVKIPTDVLSSIQARIREIGYMELVVVILYFAPESLTYSEIMAISKQLKKPISYEWLNTEFHRKKYSGLVRSESIPGRKEKAYALNEPGRRKAESVLTKIKAEEK
jgi:hypothetical protein